MYAPTSPPQALDPVAGFRAALVAAAADARASRARRPERIAALRTLTVADLTRLVDEFAALLHGPSDVGALTAALHDALRAMSPESSMAPEEENDA